MRELSQESDGKMHCCPSYALWEREELSRHRQVGIYKMEEGERWEDRAWEEQLRSEAR